MKPFIDKVYEDLGETDKVTAALVSWLTQKTELGFDGIVELIPTIPDVELDQTLYEQIDMISLDFFIESIGHTNMLKLAEIDEPFLMEQWHDNGAIRMCLYYLKSGLLAYQHTRGEEIAMYTLSDLLKTKDRTKLYERFKEIIKFQRRMFS